MKTVGLIGGLGPESTIDYYRQIIDAYRQRKGDGSYPSILINSVDLSQGLRLATALQYRELSDFLCEALARLASAGVSFAAITANTPHMVFDEVRRRTLIPLLSIVECAREEAQVQGLKRVALFGTRMTMQAAFYPEVFHRAGMEVIPPSTADQDVIHNIYIDELLVGKFLPQSHDSIVGVIDRMRDASAIDGVLLAGTELPLLLREPTHHGVPLLDTTKIHVSAIVTKLLE